MSNKIKYQIIIDPMTKTESILDLEEGFVIPKIQENRHYKQYLEWYQKGNQPLPPEQIEQPPLPTSS